MKVIKCPGCTQEWEQRGDKTGHCAGCHRTFASLTVFDMHQRWDEFNLTCMDPYTVVNRAGEPRLVLRITKRGDRLWGSASAHPASWSRGVE